MEPMNSESTKPPLEPHLIPDSPTDRVEPESKPGPQPPVVLRKKRSGNKSQGPPPSGPSEAAKYTIAEAFDFYCACSEDREDLNFERAIRAVGFLLHWVTQTGNKPIEGPAASGLGHILDDAADQFHFVQAAYERQLDELRDKLRRAGIPEDPQ
jgi:hypothetical protein